MKIDLDEALAEQIETQLKEPIHTIDIQEDRFISTFHFRDEGVIVTIKDKKGDSGVMKLLNREVSICFDSEGKLEAS